MPEASSPSFIYQHSGTQDDFSYSDRLSTAMIYKAIGMLSSLETIVHHLSWFGGFCIGFATSRVAGPLHSSQTPATCCGISKRTGGDPGGRITRCN